MVAYDYLGIRDELMGAGDELILLGYLKPMIKNGAFWPDQFKEDADVFNKKVFNPENTIFVIVNPRTEACGKTDGCEYGFKKILKYKRSWVMEEYRLPNPKQDYVICKIRLLFRTEIMSLFSVTTRPAHSEPRLTALQGTDPNPSPWEELPPHPAVGY
ncbi:hypothetical protein N665_0211s0002 [Sinapis alba]|nr:hypothetical protein N665_0211s0002 [Sinapis alba]